MSELLQAGSGWALFGALIVWGFLPGLVLDLILRAYQREDPRRRELQAELYVVPRWERPFWVFQQLEVAMREEGYPFVSWWFGRWVWHRAHLRSGVKSNRAWPDSFWIPSQQEKDQIQAGDAVRLMWQVRGWPGERMWVEVISRNGDHFTGWLKNDPVFVYASYGELIRFHADHVIDIHMSEADIDPDEDLDQEVDAA